MYCSHRCSPPAPPPRCLRALQGLGSENTGFALRKWEFAACCPSMQKRTCLRCTHFLLTSQAGFVHSSPVLHGGRSSPGADLHDS